MSLYQELLSLQVYLMYEMKNNLGGDSLHDASKGLGHE
jgi:hypothetical protein